MKNEEIIVCFWLFIYVRWGKNDSKRRGEREGGNYRNAQYIPLMERTFNSAYRSCNKRNMGRTKKSKKGSSSMKKYQIIFLRNNSIKMMNAYISLDLTGYINCILCRPDAELHFPG